METDSVSELIAWAFGLGKNYAEIERLIKQLESLINLPNFDESNTEAKIILDTFHSLQIISHEIQP